MAQKIISIIGMGKGIGLGVAEKFAAEGYTVCMFARKIDALSGFQKNLTEKGYTAYAYVADASKPESLKAALQKQIDEQGAPTVLLYNAAVLRPISILEDTAEGLTQDFQVNVAGALVAVQAVLDKLKTQTNPAVLLTGGGFALQPIPAWGSLGIGKAGMRNLAFSLSAALQPMGIYVGTVTVCGMVSPKSEKHNPTNIANIFFDMYQKRTEIETIL